MRSLGSTGPVATINAGWEEREDDDAELDRPPRRARRQPPAAPPDVDVLDQGRARSPRPRWPSATGTTSCARFYGIRLQAAIDARARRSPHRTSLHAIGAASALESTRSRRVRDVDDWYAGELDDALPLDARATAPLDESGAIGWHRGEIGATCSTSARAVVIAGGHVGTLLRTLRLFDVTIRRELPVVAWSAGAMALTDQVVLFHDFAPHGVTAAEVLRPRARPGAAASSPCRTPSGACGSTTTSGCAVLARRFAEHRLPAARRRRRRALPRRRDRPARRAPASSTATGHVVRGGRRMSAHASASPSTGCASGCRSTARPSTASSSATAAPIIEGERATFLYRGDVDEVWVRHRVVGLPDPLAAQADRRVRPLGRDDRAARGVAGRVPDRDPQGRALRALQRPAQPPPRAQPDGVVVGVRGDRLPRCPTGCRTTRRPGPGTLVEEQVRSKALRRDQPVQLYLPARFNRAQRYPLLVVHDGTDYLEFAAMKTVLDNLIHRLDVDPLVAVFVPPRDRLKEYPNHAPHARFIARELVPMLTERLPLVDAPEARCLMGQLVRRRRVALDGGALPRLLRLAAAPVGVARLHRHRLRARRRPGVRPGREVRQPLPGEADRASSTGSS